MITAKNGIEPDGGNRKELRRTLLKERRKVQLDVPDVVGRLAVCAAHWLDGQDCMRVGFYRPVRGEPDLTDVFSRWVKAAPGRSLCVPVVDDLERKSMHYALWTPQAVRAGAYGIEEPAFDAPVVPQVIFVPCVGVTRQGYRLGNGGGFFDRWLAEQSRRGRRPVTVAAAFDCLVTDRFVPEDHDEPLDWILTESGCRRAFSSKKPQR